MLKNVLSNSQYRINSIRYLVLVSSVNGSLLRVLPEFGLMKSTPGKSRRDRIHRHRKPNCYSMAVSWRLAA